MPNDSEIDRLLRDAGEQWRSAVAIDRDVEARTFLHAQRPHVISFAIASLGLFASVAVFSVVLLSRPAPTGDPAGVVSTPSSSQHAVEFSKLVVGSGDTVVATGTIGVGSTGDVYLCPGELASRGGALGCRGGRLVQVAGVDAHVWDGRSATVHGTWTGEVVQVADITPAGPISPDALGPAPCAPPAGGWPGNAPSDAVEAAGRELESEVRGHPGAYVGLWPAHVTDAPAGIGDQVVVVGTVDDVEAVRSRLARIYPFNLCVVPVEFSTTELESVVAQLSAVDPSWLVEIEPRIDRVLVTATALDAAGYAHLVPVLEKVELHVTLQASAPAPTDQGLPMCGRLGQEECERAIALVRSLEPAAVEAAWAIVVDDVCPPSMICDRMYPFTAAVVLVPNPNSSEQLRSFLVVGQDGPERVLASPNPLPPHIAAMIEDLR